MAQELITPQIPEPFKGLLSNTKVVQNSIFEKTEKKVSFLEGRRGVYLYSPDRSPPSLNNELDISSPNFISLAESFFTVKLKYSVKDARNGAAAADYTHWICHTSPGHSWFKNIRMELNGVEVTQSSKVADRQPVNHVLSLMESSVAQLQYSLSDLYGVQKLDSTKALSDIPLGDYQYGVKRKHAYAFPDNTADGDDFDSTDGDHKVKRLPSVLLTNTETFSNTVQENIVRVVSGNFQFKMRPFIPLFNVDDSWLPPDTQIKIRFDLPQPQLSRYLIISDKGGGPNHIDSVGNVTIELTELDFNYTTYRMRSEYTDQVRLSKQLFYHSWCPRLVQKSITDDAGTIELLRSADISRRMILFISDLKMADEPILGTNNATNSGNRLAMIHANLAQLRVTINDDSLFDSPLTFLWECSQNTDGTYYYDYNKSTYLRAYNLVQEFFGKTYGTEIPITASDFCNNFFMIPINLNLDRNFDNQKIRGNLSIYYQFGSVAHSPVQLPSDQSTSIKVNLICLDQYQFSMDKERGIKWEIV